MIKLLFVWKIFYTVLISALVGVEREQADKPCGVRTVTFITLGATLVTILTKLWFGIPDGIHLLINAEFDTIRAIAYYLVAIGFVGSGIITRNSGSLEGVTTASLLLPMSVMGVFVGMGEYFLSGLISLTIWFILRLKYLTSHISKEIE